MYFLLSSSFKGFLLSRLIAVKLSEVPVNLRSIVLTAAEAFSWSFASLFIMRFILGLGLGADYAIGTTINGNVVMPRIAPDTAN